MIFRDKFSMIFKQVENIITFFKLAFRHRKDFIILDTYAVSEASKIGEFTFRPVILINLLVVVVAFVIVTTVALLHYSPLGFYLLSQQKHPLEAEFAQVAQRIVAVNDSLIANSIQFEQLVAILKSESDTLFTSPKYVLDRPYRQMAQTSDDKDYDLVLQSNANDSNKSLSSALSYDEETSISILPFYYSMFSPSDRMTVGISHYGQSPIWILNFTK